MKKLLLTLTAVSALTFAASAQTEQGKFLLGGNVSYNGESVKDSDIKSNSFGIIPQVGYFLSDNIAVGTGIGYQWNKNESSTNVETTKGEFVLAPFGRIYSNNQGPVKFFGQLSVPMAWGTTEVNDEKTGSTAQYGVELAPGIAYFPTSNIGIEFKVKGLYYNNSTLTNEVTDVETTTNSYGLNVNSLAPSIGVTFSF